MSGIRGKDTKPELIVRQGIHKRGFRYSLHNRNILGRPDLVFPKYEAMVLVHGCFWHGHDCHLFKWPGGERASFWRKKIVGNMRRDSSQLEEYRRQGWRVAIIWECSLKGKTRIGNEEVVERLATWLRGTENFLEVRGQLAEQ